MNPVFHPSAADVPAKRSVFLDLAILFVVGVLVLFLQLGNSRFWDQDEGYYASVAYEMYRRGDWIVPTFNEQLFAHKPPMMYWGMLLGFHAFGVSEFSARIPSAIFGFGTVLLVYFLGRRLYGRDAGLIAGLAMSSCLMFTVVSRSATADAYLTFFVSLAIFLWSIDALKVCVATPASTENFQIRWRTWVATYAAMGCAVLSKGPIGLAFPITILASVHLLEPWFASIASTRGASRADRLRGALQILNPWNVVRTLWRMRPITGIAVVCLVSGPWFLAMQWKTDGAFLGEFLGVHHLQRFSEAMDNHSGPVYYYVIACLVGLYPWSAFAIPTTLTWFHLESRSRSFRGWLIISMWIAVYLVVFSLASTKLPNYVIPAYPAFALIIGAYVATWVSSPLPGAWRWQAIGWIAMVSVGLLVIVGPLSLTFLEPSVSSIKSLSFDASTLQTLRWVSLLGVPLVIGGAAGWAMHRRGLRRALAPCFAGTAVVMMLLFWQLLVPLADRHQTPQDIATELSRIDREKDSPPSIAVFEFFRPSMVYYAGDAVDFLPDVSSLAERLTHEPKPVIVLNETALGKIQEHLPPGYRVTQSHAAFPKRGKVLVLEPTLRR
ncbi:MAG: ArnT family glycosyltransferase [Planctomycetota bacterium]